mgnify:CR=1 FL=1
MSRPIEGCQTGGIMTGHLILVPTPIGNRGPLSAKPSERAG